MIPNLLKKTITIGLSEYEKQWANRVLVTLAIIVSLLLVFKALTIIVDLHTWTLIPNPAIEENEYIFMVATLSVIILFLFLIMTIAAIIRAILSGIRRLIQQLVVYPVKRLWGTTTSLLFNSYFAEQILSYGKRWFGYWETAGSKMMVQPLLSYLEPELIKPISDITQLSHLHLPLQEESKALIKKVVERYDRWAWFSFFPLTIGLLASLILPLMIISRFLINLPSVQTPVLYGWLLLWFPSCLFGFWACFNAGARRRDVWLNHLRRLAQQEQALKIAESVNLQVQTTLQERTEALQMAYQQELERYEQLQRHFHRTETSLAWLKRLPPEEQDHVLYQFEVLLNRIQEEAMRKEKAQAPRRTVRDFTINVAAGLFGAFVTYVLGLFQ